MQDLPKALAIGFALSGLFVGVRLALHPVLQEHAPLIVLLAAPILAAWWGGLVAGLSATAASALMGELLIVEPRFELLPVGPAEWVRLMVFVIYGVMFTAIIDSRRRAMVRLEADLLITTQAQRERQDAEERLREAHRRKDEFIAMLAHELRNPLAPVRSAVEILKHVDSDEPRLHRSRAVIERQVSHMARLLDDLMDTSRIARGVLNVRREPCDLGAIAAQVTDDWRTAIDSAGLRLEAAPFEPMPVQGDPVRLAQMMGNLLVNAIRFNQPGGWVRVWACAEAETGMATVSVADGGVGIAPELMDRLFNPFEQATQDLARSSGGLGLGLALTRGLAALQGGDVRVRSDGPGHGSVFILSLPLDASRRQAPASSPEQPVRPH